MRTPCICPRCGRDEIAFGYSAPPLRWSVECHADGCEILVVSDTRDEAFEKWAKGDWDYRVEDRDLEGNPIYAPPPHLTPTPSALGRD